MGNFAMARRPFAMERTGNLGSWSDDDRRDPLKLTDGIAAFVGLAATAVVVEDLNCAAGDAVGRD